MDTKQNLPFDMPEIADLDTWLAQPQNIETKLLTEYLTGVALLGTLGSGSLATRKEALNDLIGMIFLAGCVHASNHMSSIVKGVRAIKEAQKS